MVTLGNLVDRFNRSTVPGPARRVEDSIGDEFDEEELRTLLVEASRDTEAILAEHRQSADLQGLDLGFHIPEESDADSCERLSTLDDRQLRAGRAADRGEEFFTLRERDIALSLRYENSVPTCSQSTNATTVSTRTRADGTPTTVKGSVKRATGTEVTFETRSTEAGPESEITMYTRAGTGRRHLPIDNLACAIAASYVHETASKELEEGYSPACLLQLPIIRRQDANVNVSKGQILLLVREARWLMLESSTTG